MTFFTFCESNILTGSELSVEPLADFIIESEPEKI
jgi:hypothetical protein